MSEPASKPYKPLRVCICKQEVTTNAWKCKKCNWHFCSRKCQTQFRAEHKVSCGANYGVTSFWNANAMFLRMWGTWLRCRPDKSWVGMRIDIMDGGREIKEVTFLDTQSLDILMQKVMGDPEMRKSGYPHVFIVMVAWEGKMLCHEIDINLGRMDKDTPGGLLLLGKDEDPMFLDGKPFLVPPFDAKRGIGTSERYQQVTGKSAPKPEYLTIPIKEDNYKQWKVQHDAEKKLAAGVEKIKL